MLLSFARQRRLDMSIYAATMAVAFLFLDACFLGELRAPAVPVTTRLQSAQRRHVALALHRARRAAARRLQARTLTLT